MKELILKAAHRLFSEHGYHGTLTRHIAEEPASENPSSFAISGRRPNCSRRRSWHRSPSSSTTGPQPGMPRRPPPPIRCRWPKRSSKGSTTWSTSTANCSSTLVAARITGNDPGLAEVATRVSERLANNLSTPRRVLLEHSEARHFRNLDVPVSVAVSVGSVLALVLLDDWVFAPDQRRPGKVRQINEVTRMLLYGVAGGPQSPA